MFSRQRVGLVPDEDDIAPPTAKTPDGGPVVSTCSSCHLFGCEVVPDGPFQCLWSCDSSQPNVLLCEWALNLENNRCFTQPAFAGFKL